MKEIKGYIVPIHTPFNRDGSIDEEGMRHNISYLIEEGIHGITVSGSFGEFPLLTEEERTRLFEIGVDEAAGRCLVVAGTAHSSTAEVIRLNEAAEKSGADGVMITAPAYLVPSERDIVNHFKLVSERTELGITVYNNPFRTGVAMGVGLLVELSKLSNVITVKQSSKDFMDLINLIRLTMERDDFFVTNGQEPRAFPSLVMGAQASYGISPLLLGKECIAMYEYALNGEIERGRSIQFKVNRIRATFAACQATPAALLRELTHMRGLAGGYPRAPITDISDEDRKMVVEMSAEVGIKKV